MSLLDSAKKIQATYDRLKEENKKRATLAGANINKAIAAAPAATRTIVDALPGIAANAVKNVAMRPADQQATIKDYLASTKGTSVGNMALQAPLNTVATPNFSTGLPGPFNWAADKFSQLSAQAAARAAGALSLTGAKLATGKTLEIPASPATRGIFGSGYAGEQDGQVTDLATMLKNMAGGQGQGGAAVDWAKQRGISPIFSAPLIGIGATLMDLNPFPGDLTDATRLVKAASEAANAVQAAKAAGKSADEIATLVKAAEDAQKALDIAKAGKSAASKNEKIYYHGSPDAGLTSLRAGADSGVGSKTPFIYITDNPETAKSYRSFEGRYWENLKALTEAAQNGDEATRAAIEAKIAAAESKGRVYGVKFNGRILDASDLSDKKAREAYYSALDSMDSSMLSMREQRVRSNLLQRGTGAMQSADLEMSPGFVSELKRLGYDGVKFPQGVAVINPDKLTLMGSAHGTDALATVRQTPKEASSTASKAKAGRQASGALPSQSGGDISYFYNTDRLDISQEGRDAIQAEIANSKQIIEKTVGKKLTNKEVIDRAAATSETWNKVIPRELTEKKAAMDLKLRQEIAGARESGKVDENFIRLLVTDKAYAEDAGRILQARKIVADPKEASYIDSIIEDIYKVNKNVDEIVAAAKGVDFNDPEQVTAFYRKFVKPKASDWINRLRYNSMLTSPITHLVNITSNFGNTGILAPIEKAVTGGLDAVRAAVTRTPRKYYAGESIEYAKGYYSNFRKASQDFWDAFKGDIVSGNLDTRTIPLALKGTKARKVEDVLTFSSRALEASDRFFTTLTKAGALKSGEYKVAKGVQIPDPEAAAEAEAAYRLFRSKLGKNDEGALLDAAEAIPKVLSAWRKSSNPILRNFSQLSFPFINTGTQLFKQGIEYTPFGVFTLIDHPRRIEQLSKVVIGSAVAIGVAALATDDRITWAEPSDREQKNAFRAAGMQPYAVKIGDKWVSYSKLPPVVAWNFALVAGVKSALEEKKIDDSWAKTVLTIGARFLNFFTDQSYMKQVGSVVDASKGDEYGITNLAASYPQQFIPFRGLMSWVERAIDPVQRQADPNGTQLEKTLQTIMAQLPGVATLVPPRMGPDGQPVENQGRALSAISAVKITKEDPEKAKLYKDIMSAIKVNSEESSAQKDLKARAEAADREIMALPESERSARFQEIAASDPALAEKIRSVAEARKLGLNALEKKIKDMGIEDGARAKFIWERLNELSTNEQKSAYWNDLVKKKIITEEVAQQLRALIAK